MTSLRDQVNIVADRATASVEELKRYWQDTRTAWEIVEQSAAAAGDDAPVRGGGPKFTAAPERRQELAGRADRYLQVYLAASVVQQLYSVFDDFLLGLTRAWLLAHPRHLLRKGRGEATRPVPFADVLDAPDRAAIVAAAVERDVRVRAYASLPEQLDYLNRLVKTDRPDPGERAALAELKATRDLLVHGDGVVGADYLAAAGNLARFAAGERMQLPDVYLVASLDLVGAVCGGVAGAAADKAGAAPARG